MEVKQFGSRAKIFCSYQHDYEEQEADDSQIIIDTSKIDLI